MPNDENLMWRAFRANGKARAHAKAAQELTRIERLSHADKLHFNMLTSIGEGGHVRLTRPDGMLSVDLYLTRGTLVAGDRRLSGHGLDGALAYLGVRE